MKTYDLHQFTETTGSMFGRNGKCFVTEASDLGIPPGQEVTEFELNGFLKPIQFKMHHRVILNGEVKAWVYTSPGGGIDIHILND